MQFGTIAPLAVLLALIVISVLVLRGRGFTIRQDRIVLRFPSETDRDRPALQLGDSLDIDANGLRARHPYQCTTAFLPRPLRTKQLQDTVHLGWPQIASQSSTSLARRLISSDDLDRCREGEPVM